MDPNDAIPRVFLALILGALIGLEREFTQKSAGLRTHILVTLGSTIFTWASLSDFYYGLSALPLHAQQLTDINRDPSRVAAQIVSGIGFIGGGAVLRYGTTVRGLTTAASLWTMASIGMLVGIGQYRLAIIATLLAFLVLFTIGKVERLFFTKSLATFNRLRIHVVARPQDALPIQTWFEKQYSDKIVETKIKTDTQADKMEMNYILATHPGQMEINEISRHICRLEGVMNSTVKAYHEAEDSA